MKGLNSAALLSLCHFKLKLAVKAFTTFVSSCESCARTWRTWSRSRFSLSPPLPPNPAVLGRRGRVRWTELLLWSGLHQLPRRLRVLLLGRIQTQLRRLQLRRHVTSFTHHIILCVACIVWKRSRAVNSSPPPLPPARSPPPPYCLTPSV